MIEKIAPYLLNVAGFGMTIWLMKYWFSKIMILLERHDKNYHDCREELPTKYANRKETKEDIGKLYDRTEEHKETLAFLKGQTNGAT